MKKPKLKRKNPAANIGADALLDAAANASMAALLLGLTHAEQILLIQATHIRRREILAARPPAPADRHCITCGAVLLKLCECPHCGTPIQDQPK